MYLSSANHSNYSSPLDSIRKNKGPDAFKANFQELGKNKKAEAVKLINDNSLSFPSLFLLIPEIETLRLYPYLNARNAIALKVCDKVLKNKKLELNTRDLPPKNNDQTYSVLKWMLTTGHIDDGLSEEFDEILDRVASLLTVNYGDKTILPIVVDLIFKRNKKGSYHHDLVWSFFQIRDLNSLKLIAEYLKSPDQKDVKLCSKLLHFETHPSIDYNKLYQDYLEWLKDNYNFLFFTGENFQQTSHPEACCVDLDAKYLGKRISPHNRKMLTPLSPSERDHLEQFHRLDHAAQVYLCDFAHKVHNQDKRLWSKWNSYPVSKQVDIAQSGLGGMRWL